MRNPISMWRWQPALCLLALAAFLALTVPAPAVSPEEKMATCTFGADHQKLTGAKRKRFLFRCMADVEAPAKRKPKKGS